MVRPGPTLCGLLTAQATGTNGSTDCGDGAKQEVLRAYIRELDSNGLLDNGSPLDATDVDGQTALHHAVAEGNGDAAAELLKRGAAADKKDAEGRLAVELAPDQKVRDVAGGEDGRGLTGVG